MHRQLSTFTNIGRPFQLLNLLTRMLGIIDIRVLRHEMTEAQVAEQCDLLCNGRLGIITLAPRLGLLGHHCPQDITCIRTRLNVR